MAGRQWRRDRDKERTWRRRLRDWRRSGLSVREFCEWHALSEPSFYSWRRELEQRDRETTAGRARPKNGSEECTPAARFLPVQVVSDAVLDSGAGRCLDVQLPSGVRLRVPCGFDRQTLADVLAALGSLPC
jgi:hypothetical protein